MIVECNQDGIKKTCNCGASEVLKYEEIVFKNPGALPQLILPICSACKKRIEFIFVGPNMTNPEFQLLAEMQRKGLIK